VFRVAFYTYPVLSERVFYCMGNLRDIHEDKKQRSNTKRQKEAKPVRAILLTSRRIISLKSGQGKSKVNI
jgi:hypothetical protein